MRILATIVLAAVLGACVGPAPSAAVTQTQAEAAARAAMPGVESLQSAALGPIGGFGANVGTVVPRDHMVWGMTFTGSFPVSCGPAPPPGSSPGPCPPPATSATVFIDAQNGSFIAAVTPAVQSR